MLKWETLWCELSCHQGAVHLMPGCTVESPGLRGWPECAFTGADVVLRVLQPNSGTPGQGVRRYP